MLSRVKKSDACRSIFDSTSVALDLGVVVGFGLFDSLRVHACFTMLMVLTLAWGLEGPALHSGAPSLAGPGPCPPEIILHMR